MSLGNGVESHPCSLRSDQVEELISCMRDHSDKLDTLTSVLSTIEKQNKEFVRWLLLVVCVIALGSKAVEMVQRVWGAHSQQITDVGR